MISGHIDEGLAQLGAVLKAVGMTLPATPRRAIVSLILNRIKIRLRGLHFRPRDASQISAEDLTRIDICWAAASGLGILDPIPAADFQRAVCYWHCERAMPIGLAGPCALKRATSRSRAGAASAALPSSLRAAEQIAHQLDNPHLQGGVVPYTGYGGLSDWAVEAGERASRPGRSHLPHALHWNDLGSRLVDSFFPLVAPVPRRAPRAGPPLASRPQRSIGTR